MNSLRRTLLLAAASFAVAAPASAQKAADTLRIIFTDAVPNESYTTRAEDNGFIFVSTMRLSGRDGDVTVTFDRALTHLRVNADGNELSVSWREYDPTSRTERRVVRQSRDYGNTWGAVMVRWRRAQQ